MFAPPRRHPLASLATTGLLALACHHTVAPEPAPAPPPQEVVGRAPALRPLVAGALLPFPGITALACGAERCAVADARGLTVLEPGLLTPAGPPLPLPFQADALGAEGTGFAVEGPCAEGPRCRILIPAPPRAPGAVEVLTPAPPVPTTAASPADEIDRWRQILGHDRLIPFARRVPVAGGGTVTYRRNLGLGGGLLVRVGPGIRNAEAPAPGAPITCEGWLAPHPSGRLVLLLLWPRPELEAHDAESLALTWSLPLPAPAQGLLVDPAGRFALLAETAPWDGERLVDHPALPLPAAAQIDPLAGRSAVPPDAPLGVAVLLVDLAGPVVSARVEGAFRGWLQAPDGAWLLATDRAILRLSAP